MIEDYNKDELIEQYLLGMLTGDLLDEFKEKIDSNDEFRKEVALQKAIIYNIRSEGREKWAKKLQTMHTDLDVENKEKKQYGKPVKKTAPVKKFYQNKYTVGIAASFLILIFSTLYIIKNNSTNGEKIFLAYYQPYPALEQKTRSLAPGTPSVKKQAFKAYDEANYLESVRLFKSILEREKDEVALFYLGNAYLSSDNPKAAENAFRSYLREYKEFAAESKWYLSMCYLKQGKERDAREILREIVNENNIFSQKAAEILNK